MERSSPRTTGHHAETVIQALAGVQVLPPPSRAVNQGEAQVLLTPRVRRDYT